MCSQAKEKSFGRKRRLVGLNDKRSSSDIRGLVVAPRASRKDQIVSKCLAAYGDGRDVEKCYVYRTAGQIPPAFKLCLRDRYAWEKTQRKRP